MACPLWKRLVAYSSGSKLQLFIQLSEIIDQSVLDVKRERSAVFTVDSGSSGIRVVNTFFP